MIDHYHVIKAQLELRALFFGSLVCYTSGMDNNKATSSVGQ